MTDNSTSLPDPGTNPQVPKPSEIQKSAAILAQAITMTSFSGPLPPPDILKQYDLIVPGAANRIIVMAEEQGKHRQDIEKVVIASDSRNSTMGIVAGFVVSLLLIGASVFLIIIGKSAEGTVLGTTDVVALVAAFIYGTNKRRGERENRRSKNNMK